MEVESRETYAGMLRYFWEEKGDIERYCYFDRTRMAADFPDVLKAWDDYVAARNVLGAALTLTGRAKNDK